MSIENTRVPESIKKVYKQLHQQDNPEQKTELIDKLTLQVKQTPGTYPLEFIIYNLFISSYADFEKGFPLRRFEYGFFYKIGEDKFRINYRSNAIWAVKSEQPQAQITLNPPGHPLLKLPYGYRIDLYQNPLSWDNSIRDARSIWTPRLPVVPSALTPSLGMLKKIEWEYDKPKTVHSDTDLLFDNRFKYS
jgi:hypothetical protein